MAGLALPATSGEQHTRIFWDSQKGSTAMLTGGAIYESRSSGTLSGHVYGETEQSYTESLLSHRYDLGGSAQKILGSSLVLTGR